MNFRKQKMCKLFCFKGGCAIRFKTFLGEQHVNSLFALANWQADCAKRLSYVFSLKPTSGSPKPHPSKPHPCNMPQAKTEVALQFSECCAAEVALQQSLFCSAEVIFTKSCAAASGKLQCNIDKAAFAGKCRFPADFKLPRLGSHV